MIAALLRLLLIAGVSALLIGVALFFLRWLGFSQEFAPLNHPLLKQPWLVFADGGDLSKGPPQSLPALRSLRESCPQCIAKVDARRSSDGIWFIYPNNSLEAWTNLSGYFSLSNSETITSAQWKNSKQPLKILRLEELMTEIPDQPFLLIIHTRDASQLTEVLEALKQRGAQENLVIQSPFRQVLMDARKERPNWLFGVSPSGMARLVMMEALYIETMADIWSDFIISPQKIHGTNVFTDRLMNEFKRRHKWIILESEENLDQLPENLKASINGVVTSKFTEAVEFFQNRQPN